VIPSDQIELALDRLSAYAVRKRMDDAPFVAQRLLREGMKSVSTLMHASAVFGRNAGQAVSI
jgi:hypothetical protein